MGLQKLPELPNSSRSSLFLNDYAETIISSVNDTGGDVLKLIGDGILATFTADDAVQVCRCTLEAERSMRARISSLNHGRASKICRLRMLILLCILAMSFTVTSAVRTDWILP
jgi:adenylate cyclase